MSTGKSDIKAIAQRILTVIKYSDLSKNAFATKIGHRNMTKTLANDNVPGTKIILAIHESYPEIDLDWLLTGRGNMFHKGYKTSSDPISSMEDGSNYQQANVDELVESLRELTEVVKRKL